jgi:glycosyltransferase involved in cell wall biosynthesis
MVKSFFSVIIPTYNRANTVLNCLQKLKEQSFSNWECIIVDDGSTDNTRKMFKNINKQDNRIHYFYQENSERSIARNNGAKNAKGKYLIFLDSDDEFETNHLDLLFKEIKKTNFIHGMYFTNGKIKSDHNIEIIEKKTINSPLPIEYFINNSVVPARVCLHYSILEKLSFDPRTIIVEDTVLWTEILDSYPVLFINIDSVIYNWHGDNSVNVKKFNAYLLRLNGLKILFNKKPVGKKIPIKIKKSHIDRCYLGIAEYNKHQSKKIKSILWILFSILKYPTINFKHKINLLTKYIH